MGATLAKIAIEDGARQRRFELLSASAVGAVAELLSQLEPASIGITGGGAIALAERLAGRSAQVNEFAAWGAGATQLLGGEQGPAWGRYLLVSLGTGTSVLAVDGMSVNRLGGTALGGGTVVGLGRALLGCGDFAELCRLAEAGRRSGVDLMVSDIYRAGEIPLMAELTASSFGKVGLGGAEGVRREDLAAALMNLVGENVALICGGLAVAAQIGRVVFGGSTLRENPALARVLETVTRQLGRQPTLLRDGEFAGAVGSLELARER